MLPCRFRDLLLGRHMIPEFYPSHLFIDGGLRLPSGMLLQKVFLSILPFPGEVGLWDARPFHCDSRPTSS